MLSKFLKIKHSMFLLCALFFLVSFLPFFSQLDIVCGVSVLIFFVLSIVSKVSEKKVSRPLLFSFLVTSFVVLVFRYPDFRGLEQGIALLAFTAVFKLFEMKGVRDYFILLLITQLMMVGNYLLLESLLTIVYILLMSLIMFYLFHSFSKVEGGLDSERKRINIFIKIYFASISLSILMFFTFPRSSFSMFFMGKSAPKGTVGFSSELDPGKIGELIEDDTPVFRAETNYELVPSDLYWYGAVLSKTDGRKWTKGIAKKSFRQKVEKEKFNYKIEFDQFSTTTLFWLRGTRHMELKSKGTLFSLDGMEHKAVPFSNQKLRLLGKVSSEKDTELEVDDYLQLPKELVSSENIALAKKIINGETSAGKISRKILSFFRTSGFSYSLKPPLYTSNFLEEFLDKKIGYCEHFASAFSLLARLAGVKARVIVGFQGGVPNLYSNFYTIRAKDAHAWVEVWDKEKGWLLVDPTSVVAPDRIRLGPDYLTEEDGGAEGKAIDAFEKNRSSYFTRISHMAELIYYRLNSEFISYDMESQKSLFNSLGIKDPNFKKILFIFLGLVSIIVSVLFIYFRIKRKSYTSQIEKKLYELKKKFNNEELLDECFTSKEFYEKASKTITDKKELARIIELYEKLKYGKRTELLEEYTKAVNSFKIELKRT